MDAWDPIGTDGFDSVYSNYIAENLYDPAMFESPASAIPTPLRAVPIEVQTKARRNEEGDVVGDYEVPQMLSTTARLTKPGYKLEKERSRSPWLPMNSSLANFTMGSRFVVDLLYAQAFQMEWASKEGDDDLQYEQAYSSSLKSGLDTIIGWVLNEDDTITVYFDYNFPASKEKSC